MSILLLPFSSTLIMLGWINVPTLYYCIFSNVYAYPHIHSKTVVLIQRLAMVRASDTPLYDLFTMKILLQKFNQKAKFFYLLCLSVTLIVSVTSPTYSAYASTEDKTLMHKTLMQPQGEH